MVECSSGFLSESIDCEPKKPHTFHSSIEAKKVIYIHTYSLLALPGESLGYTALMAAPPKVQPMFVSYTLRITRGYTALMGAPPKGQPNFVSST